MCTLLALMVLGGCAASEDGRTALVFQLDAGSAPAEVDAWYLVVDPESPYQDAEGNALGPDDNDAIGNWVLADAPLELRVRAEIEDGAPASIELRPGSNTSPFEVTLHGWYGSTLVAANTTTGPYGFVDGAVLEFALPPAAPLEEVVTLCNNGQDDDGDGWTDAADPECAAGDEELGPGDTACNDGIDNDADGGSDAGDPDCASALDPHEDVPCLDGTDNDGDGWTDAEDPDCADGELELGPGITACNDRIDNDSDGRLDAADRECDSALDDDEATPPCENGDDDDNDGWVDALDPDCAAFG
ncbi:MAG: hypothetical protein RLZZ299_2971, partial [Pseudomonadota bacterium]